MPSLTSVCPHFHTVVPATLLRQAIAALGRLSAPAARASGLPQLSQRFAADPQVWAKQGRIDRAEIVILLLYYTAL